ncbi:hypothetical protein WOLCODRAFT_146689 [Wolfiporia cocos MD-104 SS10]|uniref:Uncharacterized protein n=1 Tax=Wolfiporia cocos (strain MD-104) TaxID=742152 RepID=A0A2H3JIG7_WOLCO|nr:hypothetical protein WOLCODRAFT_146689 [Wolfiporia cocos MD-104 SS10]
MRTIIVRATCPSSLAIELGLRCGQGMSGYMQTRSDNRGQCPDIRPSLQRLRSRFAQTSARLTDNLSPEHWGL